MDAKENELLGKLENILFAAGDAVEMQQLAECLDISESALNELIEGETVRRQAGCGLLLRRFGTRVQLATRPEYAPMLFSLLGERTGEELTRAMLETLAIIAYRQPVTRVEIEELRGVNTSYTLGVLLEKGLIVEAGRKEALGRPILYATDDGFLHHFGIASLEELPQLPETGEEK